MVLVILVVFDSILFMVLIVSDSVLVGFDSVFDIVLVVHGSGSFGVFVLFDSVGLLLVFWLCSTV